MNTMNIEKENKFISQMHPLLSPKYLAFKEEMGKANLSFIITCVSRTILEQISLYVQGRLGIQDVNRFRWIAGLPLMQKEEDNNIVTWTLNSMHVTNMLDEDLNNDYSRAFDIAIITSTGSVIWNIKVDTNQSKVPDYDEAGIIGETVGLVWGGRWKKPDRPHFQIKEEV